MGDGRESAVGAIDEPRPAEAPSITDTSELRWFADGCLPTDVVAWFTEAGSVGAAEDRCDTYRLDLRPDQGIKRRFQETLELKVRQSVEHPPLALHEHLAGPVEVWRRWSPADGLVEPAGDRRWVDVQKSVLKRRFSPTGESVPVSDEPPVAGGCDIELVAIVVAGWSAWSFALAAYGAPETRRATMVVAWRGLAAASFPPEGFTAALTEPSGYPEWLGRRALEGQLHPLGV